MGMNPNAIYSKVKDKIVGDYSDYIKPGQSFDDTNLGKTLRAIIDEIISEIKSQAKVPAGIPVATTGSQTAQSGATTAPGRVE